MTNKDRSVGIKHECELEAEETEFATAEMVSHGSCIRLKRYLWSLIMIWRSNSRSFSTYKSEYAIRQENVRKLQMRNTVIHPFSILRTIWELWMCIIYAITFALPINRFVGADLSYLLYTLSAFNVLDVLMTFNSGYQCSDTRQVVCQRGAIARHYLRTWFIFDVLTLPSYCLFQPRILKNPLAHFARFLILFRLHTFLKYAHNLKAFHNSYVSKSNIIGLLIPIFIIMLWICYLHNIAVKFNKSYEDELKNKDFTMNEFILMFSLALQMGKPNQYDSKPSFVDSLITVFGFVLEMVFLAFIFRIIRIWSRLMYKYIDLSQQMERFMSAKRLPSTIRRRMVDYMQYKLAHEKLQEPVVFNALPTSMRKELLTSLYSRLLEKSSIFREMPMEVILKLSRLVTSAVYMPSDVVVQAGTKADVMYFIRCGMVAIYTQSGKEICHLKDGGCFGELVIIENEVRNATVIAIDWCEMCMLNRQSLMKVFANYPELFNKLQEDVHKRYANVVQPDDWSHSNQSGSLSFNSSSATLVQI